MSFEAVHLHRDPRVATLTIDRPPLNILDIPTIDRLGERMDVMLKPPEGLLAGVPGIDGTTLLGDGRVLIVLDLGEIFGNADG